jgi:hypothetical protein
MNVGSIGAMGFAGAGIAAGAPAVGCMGGLNGPLGNISTAGLNGISATRMDQLLELLGDFSSAEILIALMLAAGSKRSRHRCEDAGLGLLLGLSLASQLGQVTQPLYSPPPDISAVATGQMINLTA